MDANVVAILTDARALIVRKGWVQHTAISEFGEICAGQAMHAAHRGWYLQRDLNVQDMDAQATFVDSAGFLKQAMFELTGIEWSDIPPWNDYPERTQEEVLLTFDRALKLAGKED